MLAKDIMEPKVITLKEDTPVRDIAKLVERMTEMNWNIKKKLVAAALAGSVLFGAGVGADHAYAAQADRESIAQVALLQSLAQGYFGGTVTVSGRKPRLWWKISNGAAIGGSSSDTTAWGRTPRWTIRSSWRIPTIPPTISRTDIAR